MNQYDQLALVGVVVFFLGFVSIVARKLLPAPLQYFDNHPVKYTVGYFALAYILCLPAQIHDSGLKAFAYSSAATLMEGVAGVLIGWAIVAVGYYLLHKPAKS